MVLVCSERDSRDRCLPDQLHVEVLARNASVLSADDFEHKLNSLQLTTCILPSDVPRILSAYTSALHTGKRYLVVRPTNNL